MKRLRISLKWLWVWIAWLPPMFPRPQEWSETDQLAFAHWLRTDLGIKFQRRLYDWEQKACAQAVCRPDAMGYNCGFAAGIRGAAVSIFTLAGSLPPEAQEEDNSPPDAGGVG